ncbi:MAG: hypothetical protein ACK5Q5_10215 [Planctomycetaceae bacterium]
MVAARWFSGALLLLTCWGCPGQAFNTQKKGADPAQAAAEPAQAEPAADAAAPADAVPAAKPEKHPNALQREAELVDRRAFLAEHPHAIELEKNVIDATDPFTGAAQGYFAGVSSLMVSTYQYDLRLQKQLNNDHWPTFENYKQILENNNIKLKGLKKRQVYAYDDETGKISILELPADNAAGE